MSSIVLGKHGRVNVSMDLDVLVRTRALIQATSGGGKSFTMRRIIEQAYGKLPIIIYDPEQEFASLREKFGFVLVGTDGETPTHPGSAELVIHRILELGASVIIDLYDLKPAARHHYMKLSLTALMNAPKKLWGPRLIFVDEAHKFCPEGKSGRSEASEAMIDLATAGRKRGFCAIWATQRLAKLNKDASAELLNRLIGPTFEDLDLERAAELLSITRSDRREFFEQMKVTDPGNFWGLGRAISKKRILIKIGKVQTAHPEVSGGKYSIPTPPAPDKIKRLLPQLADLPKQAEEKARSETELRKEIRTLKAQLRVVPSKVVPAAITKDQVADIQGRVWNDVCKQRDKEIKVFTKNMKALMAAAIELEKAGMPMFKVPIMALPKTSTALSHAMPRDMIRGVSRNVVRAVAQSVLRPKATGSRDTGLNKCEGKVLGVLAQYDEGCTMAKIALLARYRLSGGFKNALSTLRTKEYIVGANSEVMTITEEGRGAIDGQYEQLPIGQELVAHWLTHPSLGACEKKVLGTILDNPEGLTMQEIADQSGYTVSGGFKNALSRLRTASLIVGKNSGAMKPAEDLME